MSTRMPLVVLIFTIIPYLLIAQTRSIKGTVTDEKGAPLAGVSVLVKNSRNGTQTDASGSFSLSVTEQGKVIIVFSYLGYKSRELSSDGTKTVSVQLDKVENNLDDVVVIGYGTAKKKDLSGAVSSMPGKDFEKIPVASIAEAITGRMPGVTVTTTDGAPGAEIVIRVRGGGSITQDNAPLYIVDGFPVDNINNISPADVERFDVLKDAAASAIYGARGANGVIIITTKSAKAGKTSISYNGFTQWRTLPEERQLDVLSPYEYVLAQYEYARIRNQTEVDNFSKLFGVYDDLELYKNQKGTDWQRKLFGNAAISQQHNLGITGGTDKTKISLNVTHNKDEGIMVGSGYQRTYMNFKLNHEVSKSLRFELASRYSNAITDGAGTSGTSSVRISDGVTTRPVNGLADHIDIDPNAVASGDDDYDQFLKSLVNPIDLTAQDYRKRKERIFNMSAAANWTIIPGLVYRSELGLDYGFNELRRYYGPLTGESRNVGGNLPLGELTNAKTQKYRWANTLTYAFKKGADHDFNVMAGQEVIDGSGFSQFTRAKYFAVNVQPEVLFSNMSLGTPDRNSSFESPHEKLVSFFGRVQYQYKGKYLFNLTTRGDASSKFAPGKRLGIFPAASAAWRISQEDFMENVGFITELKLRASYGHAGNNRIDNNMYRRTYVISDVRTIGFGDIAQPYWTFGSNILDNPDLKWETTITRNLGLDFSILNNRISGSLDMYMNTTKDLLVQSDIPQTTGFPYQMRNIGQTSNKGIELNLNATIINKRDFSLSASFNVGVNRANIDKLDGVDVRSLNSNWAGTDLKSQDDYRLMVAGVQTCALPIYRWFLYQ
jgi:TonB-linked SusC/RagA family outer membrane protein